MTPRWKMMKKLRKNRRSNSNNKNNSNPKAARKRGMLMMEKKKLLRKRAFITLPTAQAKIPSGILKSTWTPRRIAQNSFRASSASWKRSSTLRTGYHLKNYSNVSALLHCYPCQKPHSVLAHYSRCLRIQNQSFPIFVQSESLQSIKLSYPRCLTQIHITNHVKLRAFILYLSSSTTQLRSSCNVFQALHNSSNRNQQTKRFFCKTRNKLCK